MNNDGVLDLSAQGLAPEALEGLLRAPELGEVETLILSDNPLGPRGTSALLRSRALDNLSGLTELRLDRCAVGDLGVAILAGSPIVRRLTVLSLCEDGITSAGALSLARSPFLRGLTRLRLDDNLLGDAGVKALIEAPWLKGLTELRLDRNDLGNGAALALAYSPKVRSLEVLSLEHNRIRSAGERALSIARSGRLLRLEVLRFGVQDGASLEKSVGNQLVLYVYDHQGGRERRVPITKPKVVVGSDREAADVVLSGRSVSRQLFAIALRGGHYYLITFPNVLLTWRGYSVNYKRLEEGDIFETDGFSFRIAYEHLRFGGAGC